MAQYEPVPYDVFHWGSVIDNFVLFFGEGDFASQFRKHRAFEALEQQSPSLVARLREELPKAKPWTQVSLEPYRNDLYKGYLSMRIFFEQDADLGVIRPK